MARTCAAGGKGAEHFVETMALMYYLREIKSNAPQAGEWTEGREIGREVGMADVKRMLVAVTGTTDCIGVFQYALGLAEKFEAKLYVLDIVYNPFAYTGWNLPIPSMERDYQHLLEEVRHRLALLIGEKKKKGFPVESLVREGDPLTQITRVVEEEKIDLLLMPAHEETRMEHFLSGKMAERIIRRMPCSVLLVKVEPTSVCEVGP